MIESPELEIGAVIFKSRSRFNHLPLQLQCFLAFVPFLRFLFDVGFPVCRDDPDKAG